MSRSVLASSSSLVSGTSLNSARKAWSARRQAGGGRVQRAGGGGGGGVYGGAGKAAG